MNMMQGKLIKISIIGLWLLTTSILVTQNVQRMQATKSLPITTDELANADEIWLGIYFKADPKASDESLTKVGYTKLVREKIKEGWKYEERTRMRMTLQGQKRVVQTQTRATVDSQGRLKYFDFDMKSGPVQLLVWGQIRDNRIEIKIETAGSTQSMSIPFKEEPRIPLNLLADVDLKSLKVGQTINREFFDPVTMGTSKTVITFLGTEPYKIENKTITAYKLRQNVMGLEVTSWLDENENTIREEAGNLVTRRESPKYAVSEGWKEEEAIDFIALNAVPVNVKISDPKAVNSMKLEISGIDFNEFSIPDWRQKLVPPSSVEIAKEDLKNLKTYQLGDPEIKKNFAEYLNATPTIQSEHPEIKTKAKHIIGDYKDAISAAKAINEWVYKNLEKEITISIPSALEVLDLMRGDCNEHTILTVAFLRAVGIPSKVLAGLVYMDGAFYYHAWVGAYVGEWIAIDPTFGLFPADAARLKLVEGDLSQQVKILQALGRIGIKVEHYE